MKTGEKKHEVGQMGESAVIKVKERKENAWKIYKKRIRQEREKDKGKRIAKNSE